MVFVRVNQVLVRLWARAAKVCPSGRMVAPLFGLMSDREGCRRRQRPTGWRRAVRDVCDMTGPLVGPVACVRECGGDGSDEWDPVICAE